MARTTKQRCEDPKSPIGDRCRCMRCGRTIPHLGKARSFCECGADLTIEGAVSLCFGTVLELMDADQKRLQQDWEGRGA